MNQQSTPAELELLKEGTALFSLLGRLIYGVPDRELFDSFAQERLFEEIPFVDNEITESTLSDFSEWAKAWDLTDKSTAFSDLRAEYTRLFVGQRKVLAPLWESVYFNRDRMVFQAETFQVRAMYKHHGLQIDKFSHEPDDHLSYELLFIAALFQECAKQATQGDWQEVAKTWADLRSFAVCHPLAWVSQWNDQVQRHSQSGFYRGYAALVVAALQKIEALDLCFEEVCEPQLV